MKNLFTIGLLFLFFFTPISYATSPRPAKKTKNKSFQGEDRKRRRGEVSCKNGCGLIYYSAGFTKKRRDAFDYHEKATCPNLPVFICEFCSGPGRTNEILGLYKFELHCRGQRHKSKRREREREREKEKADFQDALKDLTKLYHLERLDSLDHDSDSTSDGFYASKHPPFLSRPLTQEEIDVAIGECMYENSYDGG